MELTAAQRAQYERDGFLIFPDLFSSAEVAVLRRPPSKPHYLPALPYLALNRAVEPIYRGLPVTLGVFLVGSCLERADYRDVDVRCMLRDEDFDRLFPDGPEADSFWSLLCESIASMLASASGLPIDFQIQRMTDANAEHPKTRNALGHGPGYPGEVPSWLVKRRIVHEP